jgi:hypothetical protein
VWRELIDRELASGSAADEEAVLDAGARAAKALWVALDGVERRRFAVNLAPYPQCDSYRSERNAGVLRLRYASLRMTSYIFCD